MKILRWICVLPVSIIVLILSNIILKFLLLLTREFEPNSIILLILTSAQSTALFIIVGVKIAPTYKFKTALTLIVIAVLSIFINIFITYSYYPTEIENFRFWVNNLAAVLGLIIGYQWAKEKYKQDLIY